MKKTWIKSDWFPMLPKKLIAYENGKRMEVQHITIIRRYIILSNFNQLLTYIKIDLTGWLINSFSVCVFSSDLWFFFLKKSFSFSFKNPWQVDIHMVNIWPSSNWFNSKEDPGESSEHYLFESFGECLFQSEGYKCDTIKQCNWNRMGITRIWWRSINGINH